MPVQLASSRASWNPGLRETRTRVQHHGYTAGLIHGVSYSGPSGLGPWHWVAERDGDIISSLLGCTKETGKPEEREKSESVSCVQLFGTLWTVAHQPPLSMGSSRQGYWSGLPFPSPGHLPDPGIEPGSPALQADSLPSETPRKS